MFCKFSQRDCEYQKGDSACARTMTDHAPNYPFCIGMPNEKFNYLQKKLKKKNDYEYLMNLFDLIE